MDNSIKSQLKLIVCGLCGFFTLSLAPSSLDHRAWYDIKLGDLRIGTVSIKTDKQDDGFSSEYVIQMKNRIGVSPILSQIQGNFKETNSSQYELKQDLFKKSIKTDSKKVDVPLLPFQGINNLVNDVHSIFYLSRASTKRDAKVFVPFINSYKQRDDLDLQYDPDGFLKHGILQVSDTIPLSFDRVDSEKFNFEDKKERVDLIDFSILQSFQNNPSEIKNLSVILDSCRSDLDSLHKDMLKYLPEGSYLLYRKVINLRSFCKAAYSDLGTSKDLADNHNFSLQIQKLLKEDPKELPYSISNSQDIYLLRNRTVSFLWPRILASLVKSSTEELSNHYVLERNRKSVLGIELSMKNLQQHAVVRAQLQMISPLISFQVENVAPTAIQASGTHYVNGQNFAQNPRMNLDALCLSDQGRIGVDLGDAPPVFFSSNLLRGGWDDLGRLEVARQFAIAAVSSKNCKFIKFRAPNRLADMLNQKIKQFKLDYLGFENELLLSNQMRKKVGVFPGKYRMTVTSILSGSVISMHEFYVDPGTYTTVNAK